MELFEEQKANILNTRKTIDKTDKEIDAMISNYTD